MQPSEFLVRAKRILQGTALVDKQKVKAIIELVDEYTCEDCARARGESI